MLHRKEIFKSKSVCFLYPVARQVAFLITNEEQKSFSLLIHLNENQEATPILSGAKFKGGSRINALSVT